MLVIVVKTRIEGFFKVQETVFANRSTNIVHQLQCPMNIMQRQQTRSKHLSHRNQVANIRLRIITTSITPATRLNWRKISLIFLTAMLFSSF